MRKTGRMRNWPFAKGHGTHNDFVIINDRHGMYDPDSADVRFLCDRHGGIGGDGVLRVVRARYVKDWDGDPDLWFMDYRNADGSIAEMCGNGVRVFARYLVEEGSPWGVAAHRHPRRSAYRSFRAPGPGRGRDGSGRRQGRRGEGGVGRGTLAGAECRRRQSACCGRGQ